MRLPNRVDIEGLSLDQAEPAGGQGGAVFTD
jgi:hypothetical protein